ncbi:MAG: DUF624 domain-containing protein [Oscillospiraceae bacterium]|nr:DUF624 domain-containing protein [Oscillospiraceae bacterium]MBR2889996.1 DUF624 domain-containing protein [Oscillospiraceae bacterium]
MKFTPDSKFMILCTRLVELTKLNLLWLLCILPVFTAGAATTALITCLYAFHAGEECGSKVFFASFRKSFGKATIVWVIILFFAAMLVVDYYIVAYLAFPGRMAVIGLLFFFLFALVIFAEMIFPLISQFPAGIREMTVNAILLSIAHLPKMLLVTGMNLLPLLLLILLPQVFILLGFLWLICGFSLMGLYDIMVVEQILAPFRQTEE